MALRAIIFDLDGVLVDSEPLHFSSFQKTLDGIGEPLTEEMYKERYLVLDDQNALKTFFADNKKELTEEKLKELCDKKAKIFEDLLQSEGILPFPAVPEFVMAVSQRYPLAVATGCRGHEAELLLETAGLRPHIEVIVSADDVVNGKPNPESYLKALERLNESGKRPTPIKPEECVVIEDSEKTIVPIHQAGMKCIAVSTSHPAFELRGADLVVPSLAALRVSQLEDLFHQHPPQPAPQPQSQN